MPTKSQEIEVLRGAIAALGDDSYLAPCLRSVIYEVEAMIASDVFPVINLEMARQEVAASLAYAKQTRQDADKLMQDRMEKAAILEAQAHRLMYEARNRIESAKRELAHL